jgi:hypothetical protein
VHVALISLGSSVPLKIETLVPAVPIKKSIFPDHIVCPENGKAQDDQAPSACRPRHDAQAIPGALRFAGDLSDGVTGPCGSAVGASRNEKLHRLSIKINMNQVGSFQ